MPQKCCANCHQDIEKDRIRSGVILCDRCESDFNVRLALFLAERKTNLPVEQKPKVSRSHYIFSHMRKKQ